MPRTLPWVNGNTKKKNPVHLPAPPPQARWRSAPRSPDLVNSDLDVISGPSTFERQPRKRVADRSPSTSPPPALPDVEFMQEGFDADDIYMMVEDEFDMTARLFTRHIHHAEYQRLKRLHRSRGAATLATLGHGTDLRTKQSKVIRMQLEAEEKAHKREQVSKNAAAPGENATTTDEDDDDDLMDPQLAELMTGSQMTVPEHQLNGIAKAKSNTRVAAGYSQSPRKGTRTRDMFARITESRAAELPSAEEDEEMYEDDLDGGPMARIPSRATHMILENTTGWPRSSTERMRERSTNRADAVIEPTKGLAEERSYAEQDSEPSARRYPSLLKSPTSSKKMLESNSVSIAQTNQDQRRRVEDILARRKRESAQSVLGTARDDGGVSAAGHESYRTPGKGVQGSERSLADNPVHKQGVDEDAQITQMKHGTLTTQKSRLQADEIPTFLF